MKLYIDIVSQGNIIWFLKRKFCIKIPKFRHGRVKVRTTAEQEEIKKVEKQKKVMEYKTGITLVFRKRKDEIWDDEILLVTEKMLLRNPDIYTLWNTRREALMKNNWTKEEYEQHLQKELTLTENCLRENPKSYSVWHHRYWVFDHLSEPNYETEVLLCGKFLNIDERNFHCWDYRNFIVKMAGVSAAEEFEFSTAKIINNFSNYSSWHYRSKILSKMFPDDKGHLSIKADKCKEELDLVMNATFTDPSDTSAWFYQRWLLESCKTSRSKIWRAYLTEIEATIVFHDHISIPSSSVCLFINGEVLDCQWISCNDQKFSKVWETKFNISLNICEDSDISLKFYDNIYPFYRFNTSWICETKVSEMEKCNEVQLREQLVNYKQLFEMERQNKWALLIGIFLMRNIDFAVFYPNILNDLELLWKIDKLRYNYYKDLRSECLIDSYLHNMWQEDNEDQRRNRADLSGLGLTTLCNENYFAFLEEINLGANNLGNSLHRLYAFRECTRLSLSSNNIKSISKFPTLHKLQVLSLRNNGISSIKEVLDLVKRHNLLKLDIRENLVCEFGVKEKIEAISSRVNVKI
ncbi:geranylgeranyl transferase type-2 subunit alpha isoform X2 [Belonocnema kinseyi]|uniref:geranylgeranyl transferase type-2 subunit alpha isoform X2 n=1 Tax=Belonocnema kinseyi TaxID=2817044 RepID=UPI00143CD761|nr:geranylgeranyl transferase type-2 subunit alpha isoform X2 [Belonocnema kinseyi]